MVKSFGTAFTALGLIGALSACATQGAYAPRSASIFGEKVDTANIGVATRAQAALEKGDTATAIDFAERAVAGSPQDAGFRSLLANAYFAAGRFASAEQAYTDSLALLPNQPQLILKLALVAIAQGKNAEALAQLDAARDYLDPSDYGLAVALAGQPGVAVAVLEQAARATGADARVRQNLALAYALQGEWTMAKTVAAQDLPADQVEARVQQWMAFAKPARAYDQVAALTGVTPAASDPGQPVRLALGPQQHNLRLAMAEPVVAPAVEAAVEAPAPVVAEAAAAPAPAPIEYAAARVAAPEPVMIAAAEPAPVVEAPKPQPKRAKASKPTAEPALSPRAASLFQKASFPKVARGDSNSVVQLGAYTDRGFVNVAWGKLAKKYPALRGYSPSTARFASAKGTVYRLSVQGFASDSDARDFCEALQGAGGNCFVRSVAGDAPVRLASL
jgi:Flp pilus assembly protein TadD